MALIKAQADFAINLLSNFVLEQNKPVESTILSPLSLSMGLAMVYAGADGETKKDFGELLSGGLKEEETHAYFGKQLNSYNDDKPKNYTLEMANKVFVQKGFKILEEFKNFINENYGGRFELLNFEENVEAAKEFHPNIGPVRTSYLIPVFADIFIRTNMYEQKNDQISHFFSGLLQKIIFSILRSLVE
uniref:Serpin domain-containing protein n=1 Tax=Meloidogyne incognita TaxID=6306 RepID=A0A914NCV9_MELIC